MGRKALLLAVMLALAVLAGVVLAVRDNPASPERGETVSRTQRAPDPRPRLLLTRAYLIQACGRLSHVDPEGRERPSAEVERDDARIRECIDAALRGQRAP